MRNYVVPCIAAFGAIILVGSASAQTNLLLAGDIRLAEGWDNGLPSSANTASITVDGILGDSDVFGFGVDAIINHTAGTIDAVPGTGTGFNMNGGGIWNLSGGKILSRYILANGGSAVFNFSGGVVELADVDGTQHFGVANGGTLNISGTVVVDGSQATVAVQTGGTLNFESDWTGSWTWAPYAGDDWRDLFINEVGVTVDGVNIDGATFDSTFTVADGGQTLSINNPALPTDFNGGDLLVAGNWSNGLPVTVKGTVAVDGSFDDAAGVADWRLTMNAGTVTAGQNWHFTGTSNIVHTGGTLEVTGNLVSSDITVMSFGGGIITVGGDILVDDDSTMSFSDGMVSWGGNFEPVGSPGGSLTITGGTFTGTTTGTTRFGNLETGLLTVSGGSITASVLEFSDGLTILSGEATLSGTSATFGWFDILSNWSGSFTVTSFSGTDWETQFDDGLITLDGAFVDPVMFGLNFTLSDGGQTLAYTPGPTELIGGDILSFDSWTNGLPNADSPGTIAVDGSNGSTLLGFGAGSVIDMIDGTITSDDGFNMNGGGTWNISGGKLFSRYILANGVNSIFNLSGGLLELADVDGAQHMGAANGGGFNVSGTVVLDGSQATTNVQTGGTVDIDSNWTGTWTWGIHSGYDWENLFLAGSITLDEAPLDAEGFAANFAVTNGGQTLAIGSGGTPDQGAPILSITGPDEFDDFLINAINLNPGKTYELYRGTDLLTFPDLVDFPVTGETAFEFIDIDPPEGKAFYQLQEVEFE